MWLCHLLRISHYSYIVITHIFGVIHFIVCILEPALLDLMFWFYIHFVLLLFCLLRMILILVILASAILVRLF